jgi:predicted acyl esterase
MEDPELKEKWFAHWLHGVNNSVHKTPRVNLYPIGGTHWEHFSRFPLPVTTYERTSYEASSLTYTTAPLAGGMKLAGLITG